MVTNAGPSDADNVQVVDGLPDGLDLSGAITNMLGTLASGASTGVIIMTQVEPDTRGVLTNTAWTSSSNLDPDGINNTDTVTTVVFADADLSIEKSDTVDPVVTNNMLSYSIVVSNAGPSDVLSLVVTDSLPQGITFDAAGSSANCIDAAPDVICAIDRLPVGGSTSLWIHVTVGDGAAGLITNQVRVAGDARETDVSDNSASETTMIQDSDADRSPDFSDPG